MKTDAERKFIFMLTMARTLFTFLFENLPPTLFLLNLHRLVMAGTSYHANVKALTNSQM